MKEIKCYYIFDTLKQEFWKTYKGYSVWHLPSAAKNAWNVDHPTKDEFPEGYKRDGKSYYDRINFNDQSRYVVYETNITHDSTTASVKKI